MKMLFEKWLFFKLGIVCVLTQANHLALGQGLNDCKNKKDQEKGHTVSKPTVLSFKRTLFSKNNYNLTLRRKGIGAAI
jgi:hypothetical protein